MEITIVLGLLVLAVVLFATEKISIDIITLVLLIVLCGFGILTPREAFSGFSNDFVIILASIFVISGAMQETGVLDMLSTRMVYVARKNPVLLRFYTIFIPGVISAFMNNTTVTAMFINPLLGMARKMKLSPSKLLMPMAYATLLGGTCTLIGTSTNVAGSAYLESAGYEGLSMFELLPVGAIVLVIGTVYLMTIGRWLLPDNKAESVMETFEMRNYLSEIVVMPGSLLIGQRIFFSDLAKTDFRILNVIRSEGVKIYPDMFTEFMDGDILLVEGKLDNLLKIKETAGLEIRADTLDIFDIQKGDVKCAEVLITPMSDLAQQTIKEAGFRQRFGMVVLAVYRHGQTLHNKLGDIVLEAGDMLLVQGSHERLEYLRHAHGLAVLGHFAPKTYNKRNGILTLSFFIGAVIVGSLGWLPLSVSFLTAAVLTVLSRAINIDKAYENIEWKLLILIGGMSSFGTAMVKSGADHFLAEIIVTSLKDFGPLWIMFGFMVITVLLTQTLSNAAAALVMLPIAIQTAIELGVEPRTFGIAIILSASVSIITPMEPACLLVYGPGKYKMFDYFRVGGLLTLCMLLIFRMMIPLLWPLYPV